MVMSTCPAMRSGGLEKREVTLSEPALRIAGTDRGHPSYMRRGAGRGTGDRVGAYEDVFRSSTADPEAFWLGAAKAIDWHVAPTTALDASRPPFYRWFPDGELNVCHNALDRHVDAGRGDQAALIYDSPVTGTQRTYTYARAARRGGPVRRCARRARRRPRRPRGDLHADGAGGGGRDARLRADRRGALGGVRRVRARRSSPSGSTTRRRR